MDHRLFPIALLACVTLDAVEAEAHLLACFRNAVTPSVKTPRDDDTRLFYALSRDGLHWSWLNRGAAIFEPVDGEHVKDPFLGRIADGSWVLLGTGVGQPDQRGAIRVWRSDDLVRWRWVGRPNVFGNAIARCWAPEFVRDPATGRYLIVASVAREGHDFRTWVAETDDFVSFDRIRPWCDPGFNHIDATVVAHAGAWQLVLRSHVVRGPTLHTARSPTLAEPAWTHAPAPIPGIAQAEGPILYRDLTRERWYVFADRWEGTYAYHGRWLGAVTDDLAAGAWRPLRDDAFSFPQGVRHGAVVTIDAAEVARLEALDGTTAPLAP